MRVTQKMLDIAIDHLNSISKCKYVSNNAYGYSQLAMQHPNSTSISNLSLGNTKAELFYQIQFLNDYLTFEKNKENHKVEVDEN